jgi:hypothetical protein
MLIINIKTKRTLCSWKKSRVFFTYILRNFQIKFPLFIFLQRIMYWKYPNGHISDPKCKCTCMCFRRNWKLFCQSNFLYLINSRYDSDCWRWLINRYESRYEYTHKYLLKIPKSLNLKINVNLKNLIKLQDTPWCLAIWVSEKNLTRSRPSIPLQPNKIFLILARGIFTKLLQNPKKFTLKLDL